MNHQLKTWHEFVETRDAGILDDLLADNVMFHSPFVWKPKEGKLMTAAILTTVAKVFDDFSYIREIAGGNVFGLEFRARIGDLSMHGIDLIEFNDDGKIIDFEVMIRPANALQALGDTMSKKLTEKGLV